MTVSHPDGTNCMKIKDFVAIHMGFSNCNFDLKNSFLLSEDRICSYLSNVAQFLGPAVEGFSKCTVQNMKLNIDQKHCVDLLENQNSGSILKSENLLKTLMQINKKSKTLYFFLSGCYFLQKLFFCENPTLKTIGFLDFNAVVDNSRSLKNMKMLSNHEMFLEKSELRRFLIAFAKSKHLIQSIISDTNENVAEFVSWLLEIFNVKCTNNCFDDLKMVIGPEFVTIGSKKCSFLQKVTCFK